MVVLLAQRTGKHISISSPIVDTSLADGSRAQLTYGKTVSSHGSSFTIRKFREVPYSPIDLIQNQTFTIEEMVFFWMAVEYHPVYRQHRLGKNNITECSGAVYTVPLKSNHH